MVGGADAPGMFAFLNMFALLLVVVLYFKGRFAPSTKDAGHSGNFSASLPLPLHPPLPAHALARARGYALVHGKIHAERCAK